MWYYCGFIDTPTWSDHVGQLLVCSGDSRCRPAISRTLRCYSVRSGGVQDLSVVREWDGAVLDSRAPVYVIPPVNMLTWWYAHTFSVSKTSARGEFVIARNRLRTIERADRDVFHRVLT